MIRLLIIVILVVAWTLPAPAAVYRCRQPDGTLLLTDDPDNFPPGCVAEGEQGVTVAPSAERDGGPPPGGPEEADDFAPAADTPAAVPQPQPEPDVPGSTSFPPDLNRPDPFQQPREEIESPVEGIEPGEEEPVGGNSGAGWPGTPQEGPWADEETTGPELAQWLESARAISREYLETRTAAEADVPGAAANLQELETRIDGFLESLHLSGLPEQAQASVEQELAPVLEP